MDASNTVKMSKKRRNMSKLPFSTTISAETMEGIAAIADARDASKSGIVNLVLSEVACTKPEDFVLVLAAISKFRK